MGERNEAHRLYFHPEQGWSERDDGAVLRLDASARVAYKTLAENRFYRRGGDGAWQTVEEAELRSRALVWTIWRTQVGERSYVAFRGLRVVDTWTSDNLLHDLTVYDFDGNRLAEPQAAGRLFLLSAEDAKTFAGRVREHRGKVDRAPATPAEADRQLAAACSAVADLRKLAQADLVDLSSAAAGDFSIAGAFDNRSREQHRLLGEARAAARAAEEAVASLDSAGRTAEERATARRVADQAAAAAREAGDLLEARAGAEEELAAIQARARGDQVPFENEFLLDGLAQLAAGQGLPVDRQPGQLKISTPGGYVIIGPQIAVRPMR